MEIYVKISFIFIFYPSFLVLKHDLSDALILPIPQLQTEQVMTSLITSHIEYSIQTYHILCSFCSRNC